MRAVLRYRRFRRIKVAVSIPFCIAAIVISIALATRVSIWLGLAAFFIGTPIAAGILGMLIMLPLGYAFCGRDAMRFGSEVERSR